MLKQGEQRGWAVSSGQVGSCFQVRRQGAGPRRELGSGTLSEANVVLPAVRVSTRKRLAGFDFRFPLVNRRDRVTLLLEDDFDVRVVGGA